MLMPKASKSKHIQTDRYERGLMLALIIILCLSQSGCALIQIPLQIAGTAVNIASQMPIPPPWMF